MADTDNTPSSIAPATPGYEIGRLTEEDWRWSVRAEVTCYFRIELFNNFLAKCGYFDGRPGVCPIMPDYMENAPVSAFDKEYTYFARGRNTQLIKIGKSKQPSFRVRQLKNDRFFGDEADLLATRRGSEWERAYHNVFHTWRFCGEWFAPHPDILAEIERLNTGANQ